MEMVPRVAWLYAMRAPSRVTWAGWVVSFAVVWEKEEGLTDGFRAAGVPHCDSA